MRTAGLIALLILLQEKGKEPASTKEAMQKIQLLVGEWRVTGQPKEMKHEAWTEKHSWGFKIDREKALYQLELAATDAVFWKTALISYDVKAKTYSVEATGADDKKKTYSAKLNEKDKELILEQTGDAYPKEKATFSLLRDNRFLITFETQAAKGKDWAEQGLLGCTKEGVPFVKGEGPVCVITGGGASSSLEYKGQTYYFC